MSSDLQIKTELREQRLGDELMVFDEETDKVHVLNGTSAFIWDCLKETVDPAVIEQKLKESFDTETIDDLPALVERAITQFADKGLVSEASPSS